jgi:hypothetical protein
VFNFFCRESCQVEVSATSWSLVQGSPTDCGASLCVIWKPREWGGPGPLGSVPPKTNILSQVFPARDRLSPWPVQDSASVRKAVDNCPVLYAGCCEDILLQNVMLCKPIFWQSFLQSISSRASRTDRILHLPTRCETLVELVSSNSHTWVLRHPFQFIIHYYPVIRSNIVIYDVVKWTTNEQRMD